MAGQLRFAAALCSQEAERDHLALKMGKTLAGIIIAETVGGQPVVDVADLLRSGLPEILHDSPEDINLCLCPRLTAGIHGCSRLISQRKLNAMRLEYLINRF